MTHHIIPLGELHRHQDSSLCPCHPYVGNQEGQDDQVYIVHFHLEEEDMDMEDEEISEDGEIDILMN
jgi:hypothetical protein